MANSDIIKIGFDYRASLAQFEKETNGVFDGISNKAGKQKITIQLDAKDDKVIDKIKELQKLKLDKFTFEFGNSGLKEQLQTFDKLENKINEIISLSKGIDLSFNTKNKTDAYNQLKKYADAFKDYYGNEEAMATNAGAKAGYAYYKAYEEALRKGVAQSKLEKVTIDFDVNDSFFTKERIVGDRIKEFENFQKYGNADESNLIAEITSLENRLLKFNSAYSQVKANLGDAPITPEITKNIEEYVRLLEVAESRAKDAELLGYSSEDINSDKDLANMYLDFAKEDATAENKKYIESLKQEETQAIATAEAEQKLAEAQKETVFNTSNSNDSQIEELKSDIQEVKTELGDVKDRISSIESNGFENVRDDVEKTKESVKELNSELTEMKSNLSSTPQESNISSGMKDAFPDKDVSASVESVTNSIKEENNVLEQNTQKVKENTQAKEQNANVNLNKYDKRLDSYQGKINKYDTTIKRFEDGGWTSDAYLENVQAVKNAVKEYKTWLNELKGKDASLVTSDDISKLDEYEKKIKETIATVTNMSAAEKGYNFVSGQKELDKIHKLLAENSKMSAEAKAKIKAYYAEIESGNPSMSLDKIHGEILKIYNAEVEAGRAGRTLWDTLKNSGFHQIAAQMAGMIGVYDIINIFKQGANTLKEFDDSLTKISYTMDMTKSQLDNLGNSVLDMASDMKSSIDDAMQVAQIYANMQTSAEEIQKLSEPTLILSNLSGFDASTVADDIQAASQQFDIAAEDSMHIADVYDYISRNIQVDYSKGLESMAEGLQVAGSTAKQAGLDLEQTTAIIAKAVEKTRLEGSQVGNGLKTILTRLSKVGELSDEVDNETLSKASESLHQIGIEVYNVDGSYRQFDVIMGELAEKWDGLTDAEKSNLSYNIAATRQTNLLSAILSNFSDSMQLAEEATNANGSAIENQQKYMESFSGHLQSLETEAKIAWLNILDSETLKDGVDLLTGLVKVVGQLVDTFGLLGTAAGIGGIVASFKGAGRVKIAYPHLYTYACRNKTLYA